MVQLLLPGHINSSHFLLQILWPSHFLLALGFGSTIAVTKINSGALWIFTIIYYGGKDQKCVTKEAAQQPGRN